VGVLVECVAAAAGPRVSGWTSRSEDHQLQFENQLGRVAALMCRAAERIPVRALLRPKSRGDALKSTPIRDEIAKLRRYPGRVRDWGLRSLTKRQEQLGDRNEHLAEQLALAIGLMEARRVRSVTYDDIQDAEFRVFSQWGEDGIIQYLISHVPIDTRTFVEFGVEDYRESNTRFLLQNDYWHGLILDGGTAHLDFLSAGDLRWRHTIEARSVFLTRENINQAIREGGMHGDIGLLSVDVDGNDYWLLDAIDVVTPRILVVEYNSLFGATAAVTIPYDQAFSRNRAHWSGLFYGASLGALHHLAVEGRGYRLVGCNRAGVNAFFVRSDVAGDLPSLSPEQAYVPRQHRESRDRTGRLSYISARQRQLSLIADQVLVDVKTGRSAGVSELVGV